MTTTTVEAAAEAPMHPALRWAPLGGERVQHRRTEGGDTACGLPGPLVLAEPTDGYCPDCFPEP